MSTAIPRTHRALPIDGTDVPLLLANILVCDLLQHTTAISQQIASLPYPCPRHHLVQIPTVREAPANAKLVAVHYLSDTPSPNPSCFETTKSQRSGTGRVAEARTPRAHILCITFLFSLSSHTVLLFCTVHLHTAPDNLTPRSKHRSQNLAVCHWLQLSEAPRPRQATERTLPGIPSEYLGASARRVFDTS